MKFAEKVRAARLNIGYTQKQLAEITHVALRTIVSYEKGESYPRKRETYAALANALNVETNYLLTEDEDVGGIVVIDFIDMELAEHHRPRL